MVAEILANPAHFLKEVKLLASFTEAELKQIAELGTINSYEAHANIVIEGELTWGLFLILEGTVGIFKNNKLTGDVYDIGQLHKGNFFGEMSLIDENPRSATVRALTPVHLMSITRDSFLKFISRTPEMKHRFFEDCIKDLVGRLRDLDDDYVVSQYQLWRSAVNTKKKGAA